MDFSTSLWKTLWKTFKSETGKEPERVFFQYLPILASKQSLSGRVFGIVLFQVRFKKVVVKLKNEAEKP